MALAIGEQIGDYEIIGTLGAGGAGDVYKVRHLISQRVEALKIMRPQHGGSTEPLERFMREIRVLASLNHANIAALHTAFRHGDDLAMVMEFVEGSTLSARLRTHGISVTESLGYMRQVLNALIYAHDQGVIHRDLKPSNVMVDTQDRVKLLDFGLAVTGADPTLTAAGWVLGSLHYMSPEQVNGKKVDHRSDIYSLGATLYELLTGKVPIEGDTSYAIMAGHLNQQPTIPATVNPAIPPDLSGVVMKALAKSPDDRFQDAREFLRALETTGAEKTEILRLTQVFHASVDAGSGSASSSYAKAAAGGVPIPKPTKKAASSGRATYAHSAPSPRMAAGAQRSSVSPPVGEKSPSAQTPAVLERIAKELAVYIGPIAKIMVQKAASQHDTIDDLYKALAEEIETSKDREKFMATRRNLVIGSQ